MSGSTESQGRFSFPSPLFSLGQFAGRGPGRGASGFLRQGSFLADGIAGRIVRW